MCSRARARACARARVRSCACGCVCGCACAHVCLKLRLPGFFHQTLVRTPVWECVRTGVRSCANRRRCCAKTLRIRAVPPRASPVGEGCQLQIFYMSQNVLHWHLSTILCLSFSCKDSEPLHSALQQRPFLKMTCETMVISSARSRSLR